jgi:hypothetical protein
LLPDQQLSKEDQMRRLLVLGFAALLAIIPQVNDAAARGGFGGGFHGGFGGGGFHGGFGGFHGAGFGGFHGGFARPGFAPGFAGGWHGGGMRWAGGVRPGWGWRPGWGARPGLGWRTGWGWNRGWGWRRPVWPWVAGGALGFAAVNSFAYDCPLVQQTVWDGFSWRVVWTRSCDSYW